MAEPGLVEVMLTEQEPVVPVVQLEGERVPRVVVRETSMLAWLFDVWTVIVAGTLLVIEETVNDPVNVTVT